MASAGTLPRHRQQSRIGPCLRADRGARASGAGKPSDLGTVGSGMAFSETRAPEACESEFSALGENSGISRRSRVVPQMAQYRRRASLGEAQRGQTCSALFEARAGSGRGLNSSGGAGGREWPAVRARWWPQCRQKLHCWGFSPPQRSQFTAKARLLLAENWPCQAPTSQLNRSSANNANCAPHNRDQPVVRVSATSPFLRRWGP